MRVVMISSAIKCGASELEFVSTTIAIFSAGNIRRLLATPPIPPVCDRNDPPDVRLRILEPAVLLRGRPYEITNLHSVLGDNLPVRWRLVSPRVSHLG